MKITIEIELSKYEESQILQNSIERVMNNAIAVGIEGESFFREEIDREKASTLWQDCDGLKAVVTKLWNAARNEIFKGI